MRARLWSPPSPWSSTRSPAGASHLVTVNDYLARRDAGWMGPLYTALGLTIGITHSPQTGLEGSYVYDPEYTDERTVTIASATCGR